MSKTRGGGSRQPPLEVGEKTRHGEPSARVASTCARAATNQTSTPPARRRQAARDRIRAVVGVRVSCEVEGGERENTAF